MALFKNPDCPIAATDLSAEAVTRLATIEEMRLLQSKIDRLSSFVESQTIAQNEVIQTTLARVEEQMSPNWILRYYMQLHQTLLNVKKKIKQREENERREKVRNARAKRKSALDKLQRKKDSRDSKRNVTGPKGHKRPPTRSNVRKQAKG